MQKFKKKKHSTGLCINNKKDKYCVEKITTKIYKPIILLKTCLDRYIHCLRLPQNRVKSISWLF